MRGLYPLYVKHVLDYLLAFIALFALLPLLVVLVTMYIGSGERRILFEQRRIGKDGLPFAMYKFRTLDPDVTLPLDQRRFWLGNVLRATNLDELPQLINILKGEMSLVGPRPLPVEYATLFSGAQNDRHRMLPGITGLAQVSGKNQLSWEKKFELDLYYLKHVSISLDAVILLKTAAYIFPWRKDVSLSEERFRG